MRDFQAMRRYGHSRVAGSAGLSDNDIGLSKKGRNMGSQITLTLPEELLEQATLWAGRLGRPLSEFLAETIEVSLQPLARFSEEKAIANWDAAAVLELANSDMPPEEDERLSQLLQRQQAGQLSLEERSELEMLMQSYQMNLLRKARALREAVKRGLQEPLQP
jgi:hypothetical protein